MVLHLRKLIAVVAALILMMSASTAFAFGEENLESEPETVVSETGIIADDEEKEDQAVEPKAETSDCIFLTLKDENDQKIFDAEKIDIKDEETGEELITRLFRDLERHFEWKNLSLALNEKKIEEKEFRDTVLVNNDRLDITVMKDDAGASEPETANAGYDVICTQATSGDVSNSHANSIAKAKAIMDEASWAYGNERGIVGVSRFIAVSEENSANYCTSIATLIDEKKSSKLQQSASSENVKVVLALTALGYDPTDVNGYNLLEPLADFDYATSPYLSGPIWTLIAFDSHGYAIPAAEEGKTQTTRENLINTILDSRVGNGWAYSGTNPDVDMTCMAIQALAPYMKNANVKSAVDSAVAWLSTAQQTNGSFKSYGYETSESASQVIVALTSVGIDPNTDSRFIKNGKSAVDSLLSFQSKDGGFMHVITDAGINRLATNQGCYALTAYKRFITKNTSLYDMSDIKLVKFGASPAPRKAIVEEETADTTKTGEAALALAATGKTFSLGGTTISVNMTDDELTPKTNSVINQKGTYNSTGERKRLTSILPWIYGGAAALAALALVLVLRSRKPEER